VLIRERGGDFCYSDEEVEVMIKDIEWCRDNGMNGVVIGALTPQRTVHIAHTTAMMAAAGTMSVTFHRAFDRAKNPYEAIETLKNLGVHRLLTSGQAPTAMEGVAVLKKLLLMAENQLAVMPGSGVTVNNIQQIIAQTGCQEIHFSAKETVFSKMQYSQNETNVEMEHWESSEALIRAALLLC
jgi:copper homeostasis protein